MKPLSPLLSDAGASLARLGLKRLRDLEESPRADRHANDQASSSPVQLELIRAGFRWASSHLDSTPEAAILCVDYALAANQMLALHMDVDERLRWLETAHKAAEKCRRLAEQVPILLKWSAALDAAGRPRTALTTARRALKQARRLGQTVGTTAALGTLGETCARLGRLRRARVLHCAHARMAIQQDDVVGAIEALSNLGGVLYDLGMGVEAMMLYEDALVRARKQRDRRYQSRLLLNMGIIHKYAGRFDAAITCYQEHLEVARMTGDLSAQALALGNLGLTYLEVGEAQQALECFEEGLRARQSLGDPRAIGTMYGRLGLAYKHLDRLGEAAACYEKWLNAAVDAEDAVGQSQALGNWANVLVRQDQPDRAVELLERAIVLDRATGHRQSEGIDLHNLANAYLHLSSNERLRAEALLRDALDAHRDAGNRLAEAKTLRKLAEVAEDLGEVRAAVTWNEQLRTSYAAMGNAEGEKTAADEILRLLARPT